MAAFSETENKKLNGEDVGTMFHLPLEYLPNENEPGKTRRIRKFAKDLADMEEFECQESLDVKYFKYKSDDKNLAFVIGSTYVPGTCEPIADSVAFDTKKNPNFQVLVVADGCSTGMYPARASRVASKHFAKKLQTLEGAIEISYDIAPDLKCRNLLSKDAKVTRFSVNGNEIAQVLREFLVQTHNEIFEAESDTGACGLTTLLGGVVFADEKNQKHFVCASVGDCRAFLRRNFTQEVYDLTFASVLAKQRPTDPGGCLGNVLDEVQPDMRNFGVYHAFIKPQDTLILCSDGLYDNLDPEFIGKRVMDGLPTDGWFEYNGLLPKSGFWERTKFLFTTWHTWKEAVEYFGRDRIADVKSDHITSGLKLITEDTLNAEERAVNLMEHVIELTTPLRKRVAENPNSDLPENHEAYPGKLDHVAILAYTVPAYQ